MHLKKNREDNKDIVKQNIALLWGGWSDERDISHDSALACQKALQAAGFDRVVMLDVAQSSFISQLKEGEFDLAFVAMHGEYGEDGCIQGLLECLHIPYTFSGVLASALAADKVQAKHVFLAEGLNVPKFCTIDTEQFSNMNKEPNFLDAFRALTHSSDIAKVAGPLFVKPAHNGSSFGISKVMQTDANAMGESLRDALRLALAKDKVALIEEAIEGMEISVPVLGNEDARVLPVIEIVMDTDFYDLTTKYEPSNLHHIIPARLPEAVYRNAQEAALRAHKALGCRGCSRSDFIVNSQGVPYILETNTIPGMTETSLLPDAAQKAGISFPQLCHSFVVLAQEKM